eukprot:5189297-Prymnesium_polylepis.2
MPSELDCRPGSFRQPAAGCASGSTSRAAAARRDSMLAFFVDAGRGFADLATRSGDTLASLAVGGLGVWASAAHGRGFVARCHELASHTIGEGESSARRPGCSATRCETHVPLAREAAWIVFCVSRSGWVCRWPCGVFRVGSANGSCVSVSVQPETW